MAEKWDVEFCIEMVAERGFSGLFRKINRNGSRAWFFAVLIGILFKMVAELVFQHCMFIKMVAEHGF